MKVAIPTRLRGFPAGWVGFNLGCDKRPALSMAHYNDCMSTTTSHGCEPPPFWSPQMGAGIWIGGGRNCVARPSLIDLSNYASNLAPHHKPFDSLRGGQLDPGTYNKNGHSSILS